MSTDIVRIPRADVLEEQRCQECGRRNPVWWADNETWNLVMGGSETGGDPGGILCPSCFHDRWLGVTR